MGVRPNRRPGTCLDCGDPVEPGTGLIRRVGAKEWGAVHNDGEHSALPPATIALQRSLAPQRPSRFTTPCAGCGDTVPVGTGSEDGDTILCRDCTYGRS